MQFGWKVPEFPADGSDSRTLTRQTLEALDLVRGRFAAAWVTDHMHPWARWQEKHIPVTECWTTLTFLAARYPELTWGTIVMAQSYRSPALMAKMAATLCDLVPGKVIFGIGAGWKEDEYLGYGYDFPAPAVRIRQMEEAIEIAKRLWTEDDVTWAGTYYRVAHAFCDPKPDPLPPIMIGGSGEQLTLRIVAKHADWWNGTGAPETFAHKCDVLKRHCDAIGRDYDRIVKTAQCECIAVGGTEAEARAMAEASPFFAGASWSLVGTPAQVIEQIEAWQALGVTHLQLRFADFPHTDGVRRFMDEVMPHFA